MKKIYWMVVSLVIVSLPVTIVQGASFSGQQQGETPENSTVTVAPEKYAADLVRHQTNQAELKRLLSKPMNFQWQVAYQVFLLHGFTPSQSEIFVQEWQTEVNQPAKLLAASFIGSCDQPIENKSVVRDPVFAYTTTSFQSSRGTEYLYYFYPWWTVDPNTIRWGATDPLVQWAIWIRTSTSGIAGHNLCTKPFTLQLGNTTVSAAGGQYWVMANLYVHHL